MPTKCHVKKGDEVVVISGAEKEKRGKIIQVSPRKQRVIVEGVKMIKKHTKKGDEGGKIRHAAGEATGLRNRRRI
jgi:large subunit ribosomal protein L24